MQDKIKKYKNHPIVNQMRDIRVVSLVGFVVIVLLVSWSTASVIQTNYDLQKQINQMSEENKVLKLQNDNQKLKNQYFNTDQYLELQARKLFGKAAPGETLILVPKDVALSKIVQPRSENKNDTQSPSKPWYQKNLEAWIDYFFHRNNQT